MSATAVDKTLGRNSIKPVPTIPETIPNFEFAIDEGLHLLNISNVIKVSFLDKHHMMSPT